MPQNFLAGDNGLGLRSLDDAMNVLSSGLPGCIFTLEDVSPEFFDLRNGLAGEVFQKFVNYKFRVVFVLPPEHGLGERITELAREHRNHPCVRFSTTLEEAEEWASGW